MRPRPVREYGLPPKRIYGNNSGISVIMANDMERTWKISRFIDIRVCRDCAINNETVLVTPPAPK